MNIKLFLLLLFIPLVTSAQKIEWSGNDDDQKFDYIKILGADEEGYFVLKSNLPLDYKGDHYGFRKRKYAISYYSNEMKLKLERQLVPSPKNARVHKVLMFNEKVLLVNTFLNKEQKKFEVSAQLINNKGNNNSNNTQIDEFPYEDKSEAEDLEVVVSKNQQLFAIINKTSQKETSSISLTVCDTSLKQVYKKSFSWPEGYKALSFESYGLADNGNIYMVGRKLSEKNAGDFFMFAYSPSSGSLKEIPIIANGYNLSDLSFSIDNINNNILVAGFYSNKGSGLISGTFYNRISMETHTVTESKVQNTDENFFNNLLVENNGRQGQNNININKLVIRNDGGIVILAEHSYTTTYSFYDIFTRSYITRINYHYNDIFVVSIKPDGAIDWTQRIQKDQESLDDGGYFSSFCSIILGNKMTFIFNTSIDRVNTIMSYSINSKGAVDSKILISESERVNLVAKGALQVEENVIIIPGYRNRKFAYAKITF